MGLQLTTLRVMPEGQSGKQSLFMPTNMQPLQRSLVTDRPATPEMFDVGFSPRAPVVGADVNPATAQTFTSTVELPFNAGQADTIPLPLGTITWLDDPAFNHKYKGRRSVTLINEDTAVVGGVRFSFSNGTANGALLLPGANISFPMSEFANIYAFSLNPAGGQISLVQYA